MNFQMDFQYFTVISSKDSNVFMEFQIDLDTIDDDEPYIICTAETLSLNENGELDEVSRQLNEDYEEDFLFKQCCWDIHDKPVGYTLQRKGYILKNGSWNS